MAPLITLITGQLGLKKKDSLDKFVRFLGDKPEPKTCHCIFFENKLIEAYNEEMKYDSPEETASLSKILGNPKSLLFKVWKPAAEKVAEEIADNQDKDYILVVMHATYYHLDTRSFSTFFNIWDIKNFFQPSQVITLVDDIIDIKNRKPGFFMSADIDEEIFWFMNILIWREFEMNASISIANHIGCKFSVLALRHRLQTLADLLDGKESVYLSHSITEVKARLQRNEDVFTGTELIGEVNELYNGLTDSGIVAFSPTTIDDLRFLRIKLNGEDLSLPIIIPRWPSLDEGAILWTKPPSNEVLKHKPVFDLKIPDELRERLTDNWSAADEIKTVIQKNVAESEEDEGEGSGEYVNQLRSIGQLIKPLTSLIEDQINSRDVTLVSQASNIAAYRPIFAGNLAGGVDEEIRCFNALRKLDNSKYEKCFCFIAEKDIGNYPKRRLAHLARNSLVFEGKPSIEILEQFTSEHFEDIQTWDGLVEKAAGFRIEIKILDIASDRTGVMRASDYSRREHQWSEVVSKAKDWQHFLQGKDNVEIKILVQEGGAPKQFCETIVSEL